MTKPLLEKICHKCGKIYFVPRQRINSKYCSKSCHSSDKFAGSKSPSWKGGPHTVICSQCNQSFTYKRGNKPRKYCSKGCMDKARMKRIILICIVCQTQYQEKKSKAKRYRHSFCSLKCRFTFMYGAGNQNWKGGTSFEPYPIYFNQKFKQSIRERDKNTCKICGEHGKDVHHINYVKNDTFPENCITLCRTCHVRTNGNREYWQSYFSILLAS